jgi:hypothetical protein
MAAREGSPAAGHTSPTVLGILAIASATVDASALQIGHTKKDFS